jgi:hypothetical protein
MTPKVIKGHILTFYIQKPKDIFFVLLKLYMNVMETQIVIKYSNTQKSMKVK